jgi:hypothetical protein
MSEQSSNLYTSSLIGRFSKIIHERGLWYFLRKSLTVAGRAPYARTFLRFRTPGEFTFNGRAYRYFCHPYNSTWDNERAVEVPVALDIIEQHRGQRILEVGNVLSHYVSVDWDVVDKFERGGCVTCADAVTFSPDEPYDLIVTISTLEHVGFDDDIQDPELIPRAVANLRDHCLKPGGLLVVTVPLGYNPSLDEQLFSDMLGFSSVRFLLRTGRYEWRETTAGEVRGTGYGTTYIEAGAVAIAEYRKA